MTGKLFAVICFGIVSFLIFWAAMYAPEERKPREVKAIPDAAYLNNPGDKTKPKKREEPKDEEEEEGSKLTVLPFYFPGGVKIAPNLYVIPGF